MTEHWNLYLRAECSAPRWPWPGRSLEQLTADDVGRLPGAVDAFLRYSPSDGPIDMVHVPRDMPREAPRCRTRLAVYHDDVYVTVLIEALWPADPIPELGDLANEDLSCVIPFDDGTRGLYFGLNEKGEGIGCVQIWDPDVQPADLLESWPFSLLRVNPGAGPSASAGGILADEYAARTIATGRGLVGCIQIQRRLVASQLRDGTLPLSASRRCYATGELVSWGSCVVWRPRPDRHGMVRLAGALEPPELPRLRRIDMAYDPAKERGRFRALWEGSECPAALAQRGTNTYRAYAAKATLALNGIETTVEFAADGAGPATPAEPTAAGGGRVTAVAEFAVPDGWNRLEVLTTFAVPLAVGFQKVSGQRLTVGLEPVPPVAPAELRGAFGRWHERHETGYLGGGTWGTAEAAVHCLCHCGAFHAEPYVHAYRYIEPAPAYEQRIRETCERMLAAQHPDGWFPCHCSATTRVGQPELGDGGAFTNGSVGEILALAGGLFGEARYVDAARRAADYAWYRWEDNQNYAAFALWHLAALQEVDPRDEWLAKSVYYATNFVTRGIGPSGAQDGHNYFTGYGNITLKGMARLLDVLPAGHDYRPELREKTIRFANQMLSRRQPSGLFAGRNRKYLGYHHLVPGLFFVARAVPEVADELTAVLTGMAWTVVESRDRDARHEGGPDAGVTLALMAEFLHGRGPATRACQ